MQKMGVGYGRNIDAGSKKDNPGDRSKGEQESGQGTSESGRGDRDRDRRAKQRPGGTCGQTDRQG